MENKGKMFAAVGIIVVAVVAGTLISKGNLLQGRWSPRGPSKPLSTVSGEITPSGEITRSGTKNPQRWAVSNEPFFANVRGGPDYSIYSAELAPSSTPGYYRITSNFQHSGVDKAGKVEWGAGINGNEVTTLALKEVNNTVKSYAFDVLKTVLCAKPIHYATAKTMLDPYNKVGESNESNNSFYASMICVENPMITRAEVVKLTVIQAGIEEKDLVNPSSPSFKDVPKSSPYYKYIETAKALGFIYGMADGTFKPDTGLNRAEVAKLLTHTFDVLENAVVYDPSKYYDDIPVTHWYYYYVENLANYANKKGKLSLVDYMPGKFNPGANATTPWFKDLLTLFKK